MRGTLYIKVVAGARKKDAPIITGGLFFGSFLFYKDKTLLQLQYIILNINTTHLNFRIWFISAYIPYASDHVKILGLNEVMNTEDYK